MRNYTWFLILCLIVLSSGCRKRSSAASQREHASGKTESSPSFVDPVTLSGSGGGGASFVPKATEEMLESVHLEVNRTEKLSSALFDPDADEKTPRRTLLAVQVTVTSKQEQPRLMVEPQRFMLEADNGEIMPLRLSGHKQPILPSVYLSAGQSTSGWITFQILDGDHEYMLKTDLRKPAIRIPVEVPAQ